MNVEGIARYLAELTNAVAGRGLEGPFEGYDSTSIELGFIRETLMPLLNRMGVSLRLETQQDIERLVAMVRDQFGIGPLDPVYWVQ